MTALQYSINVSLMTKFKFELTIEWKYETVSRITVNKTLTGKKHNPTFKRAEKWVDNCIAICGKDSEGRNCTRWELKFVGNE